MGPRRHAALSHRRFAPGLYPIAAPRVRSPNQPNATDQGCRSQVAPPSTRLERSNALRLINADASRVAAARAFHVKHPDGFHGLPFLRDALKAREASGLLRTPPRTEHERPSFCSNDYLGFADETYAPRLASPTPLPTAFASSTGAGASRLVAGDRRAHHDLEAALCEWLGYPAALVFSSGYAANVGALSALLGEGDLVISDALNHASLIDGMRLSRANVVVAPHNDVSAIEAILARAREASQALPLAPHHPPDQRMWVVVESYYSMDADTPDLPRLRAVCDAYGARLIVDEAHALGIFGAEGRGLCDVHTITPDVLLGTLGKSIGAQGAFVAGAPELRSYLWNFARSFVFSTGLSPLLAAIATDNIARVRRADDRRTRALVAAQRVREALRRGGYAGPFGYGPIVPWIIGDADASMRCARVLSDAGFAVQAIRPPTVPPGTSRLRLVLQGGHQEAEITRLCVAVEHLAHSFSTRASDAQMLP